MPNYMKVSTKPGVWDTVIECDFCEGTGTVSGEVAVVDFMHGGYLKSAICDCTDCDGRGYRYPTEDEEERLYAMPPVQ